ncbi:hypothetical protein JOE59_002768 [Agromyces cerinus]|uniref:hypothetical protein n=1 Tax=Agromyces cerinus TaxID=33878 RepID=UPI00195D56E9|nr:hypothetical protein [Agromyces cerinus]MBM7832063.1 hypothetical protein [Agromyces cerinus]
MVKTANVRRFQISGAPAQFVDLSELADQGGLIPTNSLLITSTGVGSAGRTFLYTGSDSLVADGHVTVLPVRGTNTEAAYLCAYLQTPFGRQQIVRLHRGSSRQIEIYPQDLLQLQIPLLPTQVRQAIGDRWLEAESAVRISLNGVRRAEEMIEAVIGQNAGSWGTSSAQVWAEPISSVAVRRRMDAESFAPQIRSLQSAIASVGHRSLSDLIIETRKGVQPSEYSADGDVQVVKSKDVNYPEFSMASCERAHNEGWTQFLKPGQLLVNMTGEGSLGRAGVVPAGAHHAVASVDVCTLTIDARMALPEYVALVLNSWIGRRQTSTVQTGSSGQQHMYPVHFANLLIPLPTDRSGAVDLAWQRSVVDAAEARATALRFAEMVGAELDTVFARHIPSDVDLSTIPR